MDKLGISKRTVGVSSQGEEEMVCEDEVYRNADIVDFIDNKEIESMGVFNKFECGKAEEYLDKEGQ